MYMCVFIHTQIYTLTNINIYIHVYFTGNKASLPANVFFTEPSSCESHIYIHTYIYKHTYIYIYTYMPIYIRVHTHIHIIIYIHIYHLRSPPKNTFCTLPFSCEFYMYIHIYHTYRYITGNARIPAHKCILYNLFLASFFHSCRTCSKKLIFFHSSRKCSSTLC